MLLKKVWKRKSARRKEPFLEKVFPSRIRLLRTRPKLRAVKFARYRGLTERTAEAAVNPAVVFRPAGRDVGHAVIGAAGLVPVGELPADRVPRTAADAGAAAGAPGEGIVAVGTRIRRQRQRRHHRTESDGDAVFGDESGRKPEGPRARHEGDVPFGPA